MITYQEAQELHASARNKEAGKPLANHTRLVSTSQGYGVKLHDTIVVQILPGDRYIFSSGGWRTRTTKERINTYGPYTLFQRANEWYIKTGALFYDGIVVDNQGRAITQRKPGTDEKEAKTTKDLNRRILKFSKDIGALVDSDKLGLPSAGDCWMCIMHTQEGKAIGDQTNSDHLLSHLRDGYHVPGLVLNALKEAGYPSPWILVQMHNGDSVARAVKKYMQRRLLHKVKLSPGNYLVMRGTK